MKALFLRLFGIKPKPKRDFPAFARSQCHGAMNEAKAIIKRVGKHRPVAKDAKVVFVAGQKRFGRDWAWWVDTPDYRGYVLGLCSGRLIQVGIDPARQTDPAAVNVDTLLHEFVHHWLSGSNIWHDPAYDGLVPGWKSAREIVGKFK
jgi:hypothetical protein